MAQKPSFCKTLTFSKEVTLATSVQLWPLMVGSQIELFKTFKDSWSLLY